MLSSPMYTTGVLFGTGRTRRRRPSSPTPDGGHPSLRLLPGGGRFFHEDADEVGILTQGDHGDGGGHLTIQAIALGGGAMGWFDLWRRIPAGTSPCLLCVPRLEGGRFGR